MRNVTKDAVGGDAKIYPDVPRTLLLTSYPPSYPNGSIHYATAIVRSYEDRLVWFSTRSPLPSSTLPRVPFAFSSPLSRPGRKVYKVARLYLNNLVWAYKHGWDAARFGRRHGVQQILAQVGGTATVAGRVAAQLLGVPLAIFVADDPVETMAAGGASGMLLDWYSHQFRRTMRHADAHAVISEAMADEYRRRFGINPVVLYLGVDPTSCLAAGDPPREEDPVTIGSVGSVVSEANWRVLVGAVRRLNESRGWNRFKILHIGELAQSLRAPEVEVTGYVRGPEFTRALGRITISFLNLPFDRPRLSRTSFPSKFRSYVQAQRPVIGLAPDFSSVAGLMARARCGVLCPTAETQALAEAIETLCSRDTYRLASDGMRTLRTDFSEAAFYEALRSVLCNAHTSHAEPGRRP